ncbi:MAG: VWA domain-containing protein [Proteobacteria bacterium]|nr:VWA domain-containing protein [Pseudomonadota bacterium]
MTALAIRPMNEAVYNELRGCRVPTEMGAGRLVAEDVVLPLRGTDVHAELSGPAGAVTVTQTFANDRDVPLECVYIFPLPPEAAVTQLVFVVGERRLVAELQERAKAERAYQAARDAGQRASLLTSERADVFTTNVANIQPGEEVRVELTYAQTLSFDDGGFVFRFPLVLGDRYIPGAPIGDELSVDTDQVADAHRIKPPRLLPGVRPAHDLTISVSVDAAGLPLTDLTCSQHTTSTSVADGRVTVELARADELPNKDFILRWRTGGDGVQGAIWTHEDRFCAVVVPPADLPEADVVPREVVLVVDTSGSMGGPKMPAAIEAARLVLRGLREGDALQVVEFNTRHRKLWRKPKAAVDKTIAEADRFLSGLGATGGTEILSPLKDVLRSAPASGRVRHLVLITDGQVGNEAEIVRWVGSLDQNLRTFAIGIDTAVNEAFLKSLASQTRGLASFMTPSDPIAERMTRFLATVGAPVLTGASIDGVEPTCAIADLYQGRPVVVTGTLEGEAPASFTLRATGSDGVVRTVDLGAPRAGGAPVAAAVGKARVAELESAWLLQSRDGDRPALLEASLAEGILCTLTGFVVVDPTETDGGEGQSMTVPVMPPADWDMYGAASIQPSTYVGRPGGSMMPPPPPMAPAPMQSMPKMRRAWKKSAPSVTLAKSLFKPVAGAIDAFRGGGGDPDGFDAMDKAEAMDLGSDDDLDEFDLMRSAPAEPEPLAEVRKEEAPVSLAALAMRQRLDGSFTPMSGESVMAATAEALMRLLDAGNTDLRGTYRQAVTKAVAWLLGSLPGIPGGHTDRVVVMDALKQWVDSTGTTSARERFEAAAGALSATR